MNVLHGIFNKQEPHFKNERAIFLADVEALKLSLNISRIDDVRREFLKFHDHSTDSIRHSRVRILERINPEFLCEILHKWGVLYTQYYEFLLLRHGVGGLNLQCGQAICLDNLGLTPKGMWSLSIASRYAEFWAEGSVHNPTIFDQWEKRSQFIGSREFVELHNLRETDELLVYDRRGLALPVFDISEALNSFNGQSFWESFHANDAHLVRLSEGAASTLSTISGRNFFHPGEIRVMLTQNSNHKRQALHAVNYISKRLGVVGRGYVRREENGDSYILDDTSVEHSFFIMQSLRAKTEFVKFILHKKFSRVATAVFPNQNVINVCPENCATIIGLLKDIKYLDGYCRNPTDYCYLDEWFFRGEDPSFRS
ncbi:hypothetical protein [Pseudomonas fluorescens]|uniref:hypothetical protein n=1 Tax=Pseudomonas fluorescens TaxID=294 RepID=UPI00124126D0|nr:hypothetical protein [Pseudomonas fluorescens]VVP66123.1 hypothetical protein PS906_01163 [Pseudomonas fluorescens]